jgi:hypothetical protein
LGEGKKIIVLEFNFQTGESILSSFGSLDRELKNQIVLPQSEKKRPFISKINETNKVCIWGQTFGDFDMVIWNTENNNSIQYSFPEPLECFVTGIFVNRYLEDEIFIWGNTEKNPFYYKVQIENKNKENFQFTSELHQIKLYESQVNDVLISDFSSSQVVWERKDPKGKLWWEIFDPKVDKIVYKEEIFENENEYEEMQTQNLQQSPSDNYENHIQYEKLVSKDLQTIIGYDPNVYEFVSEYEDRILTFIVTKFKNKHNK